MTIYDLKPAFQNLLRPVCRRLAAAGVTANQVTIGALLLSVAAGLLLAARPDHAAVLLGIPLVLLLRLALNAIDGMLAREHDMKSALGAVLNEIGDVVSDAALYLPFALVPGLLPAPVVIVVVLAVISEMTGVVAVQLGAARRYDGPMGKSDRAFVFGALAFLAGLGVPLEPWADWVMAAVVLLLLLTISNRARRALADL